MNPIKENNKLRTEQLGNQPASEMTKREKMALEILNGLLISSNEIDVSELSKSAVHFADLLISELNKNNQ
jgi:hypothetical protein